MNVYRVLVAVVLGAGSALAADKPYMMLVGELLARVETPRMYLEVCAAYSPNTAEANSRLYDAWKERHSALLAKAGEQIARANDRLKRQGVPGQNPVFDGLASSRGLLEEQLSGMTPSEAREYCGNYWVIIELKETEALQSIPKLLEIVTNADNDLTERERT